MRPARPLLAIEVTVPRFIVFSSYGNDSVAVLQWAHEEGLDGVTAVYSDTGWAADGWNERVERMEAWAQSLGFRTDRTTSIGFKDLARKKKGFPSQRYQWCSYILKIEPGMRWLEENDPERRAACLVGVRREESQDRAKFPAYLANSANHGGRVMLAPMAEMTEEDRNGFLARAGVEPLPHRSRECKCINSNRQDLRAYTEADIADIRRIEREVGKPMFRPAKRMGARGIDEVMKWANSERGKYRPPAGAPPEEPDDLPEEDMLGCNTGYCETHTSTDDDELTFEEMCQ